MDDVLVCASLLIIRLKGVL